MENVLLRARTKISAPSLTTSETVCATLLVDVAGEQVRGRDRHDRRWDQRADDDGRVGDALEPGREHLLEQERHGQLGVGAVGLDRLPDAGGGQGHVAQQRDQPEHQRVRGQDCHIATDDVAAPRGQHAGHRVRVHEQRQRRAEGQ
jgi:hypothetical protein